MTTLFEGSPPNWRLAKYFVEVLSRACRHVGESERAFQELERCRAIIEKDKLLPMDRELFVPITIGLPWPFLPTFRRIAGMESRLFRNKKRPVFLILSELSGTAIQFRQVIAETNPRHQDCHPALSESW